MKTEYVTFYVNFKGYSSLGRFVVSPLVGYLELRTSAFVTQRVKRGEIYCF